MCHKVLQLNLPFWLPRVASVHVAKFQCLYAKNPEELAEQRRRGKGADVFLRTSGQELKRLKESHYPVSEYKSTEAPML